MDHNAFLVWWLLGIPVVVAIADLVMIGKRGGSRTSIADSYLARLDGRPTADASGGATNRSL